MNEEKFRNIWVRFWRSNIITKLHITVLISGDRFWLGKIVSTFSYAVDTKVTVANKWKQILEGIKKVKWSGERTCSTVEKRWGKEQKSPHLTTARTQHWDSPINCKSLQQISFLRIQLCVAGCRPHACLAPLWKLSSCQIKLALRLLENWVVRSRSSSRSLNPVSSLPHFSCGAAEVMRPLLMRPWFFGSIHYPTRPSKMGI